MSETLTCPNCRISNVPLESFFCSNCGTQLRIKPISTSFGSQFLLYVGSLLLPPLGFWWGFKYSRINDPQAKKIAIWCVVLTVISLLVSLYFFLGITSGINSAINTQLNTGDFDFNSY
ncbi:hypothetical protein HY345_02910 [Candidatus Microgenomates bacterium]|nr:hypothetical protein [Candidatus Microgenomates bacterium]